jgi:hypothetical protein
VTTRPLADFLPLVLPHAPRCPRPVAEQYLRLSAIEWCERTRCWRSILTTAISAQESAIVAPVYATIHEIERAEFSASNVNQYELTPTQFSSVSLKDFGDTTTGATPRYITQVAPNAVSVLPFMAGTLELSLFLKPRFGSELGFDAEDPLQDRYNVVPEHIFIQSAEHIADGALSRLLALPDQEWTNPQMAGYYGSRFEASCNRAFSNQIKGQHRAVPRSRANFL